MQTLSPFTVSEMDTLANAIHDQILNCHAQIESGSKYGYDLEEIETEEKQLRKLLDKIQEHQQELVS